MKITVSDEIRQSQPVFYQLAIGELFMNPRQDRVYMKTSPNEGVRMDTGSHIRFLSQDIVIPVDGELIVTRKN